MTQIGKINTRKVAYILGAGFSFGTGHKALVKKTEIHMPLQTTLFEELCAYTHRRIDRVRRVAMAIRKYFNPKTYRTTRKKGKNAHADLFGLSVEEIVTFFDEIIRSGHEDSDYLKTVVRDLQALTIDLISFLSTSGRPGRNPLLNQFAEDVRQTDVVITFNWDTLLDRVLGNKFENWPYYGYGRTVRSHFNQQRPDPDKRLDTRCPHLLKLHGSINWEKGVERESNRITSGWRACEDADRVVMMPPKMIKQEIGTDILYKGLWSEAEEHLCRSKKIVFVGYSFPPADFAVGNMLRRVFSEMKVRWQQTPEIFIVDPDAARLAERFQASFKISVPLEHRYLSLRSYLGKPIR